MVTSGLWLLVQSQLAGYHRFRGRVALVFSLNESLTKGGGGGGGGGATASEGQVYMCVQRL